MGNLITEMYKERYSQILDDIIIEIKSQVCAKNIYYVKFDKWVSDSSPASCFNGLDVVNGGLFRIEDGEISAMPFEKLSLTFLFSVLDIVVDEKYKECLLSDIDKKRLNLILKND